MPGVRGNELYARLIEAGHQIPTILATAYSDEAARARGLKDGIVCSLRKPFGVNDLVGCVEMAVEGGKPPKSS
jgi:FixJ family two-component response regulator